MRYLFTVCTILGILFCAGCAGKKGQVASPAELPVLAEQFRAAKPGEEKINVAVKLQPVLPTCLREDGAGIARIEYDNPTYKLTLTALYGLLGTPEEVTSQYVAYDLGKGEKANYYLLIEIYDDYVSAVRIDVGK